MPKYRGYLGLAIIVVAEVLLFSGVRLVAQWFTPIAWIGYILLLDHLNHRLGGWSLITDRRREFLLMLPLSIACWVIFEAFNLHLDNWTYLNLPADPWVRHFGYAVSFATIFPGIFQTCHLLENLGLFRVVKKRRPLPLGKLRRGLPVAGGFLLLIPLLAPAGGATYLFGLVWVGFVFLLEPINERLGLRSILRDIERGDYSTLAALMASGAVCGVLWEFWNFWAETKWVYTFPISVRFRVFEMPALGFLGFLPFAVECYSMYNFCALRSEGSHESPRTINLCSQSPVRNRCVHWNISSKKDS